MTTIVKRDIILDSVDFNSVDSCYAAVPVNEQFVFDFSYDS